MLCLAHTRILYDWYILESIHKFIIELEVLQCLIVKGSNKKQRGTGLLFQTSQKERLFHLLGQPSAFGGNLTMCSPTLVPFKKGLLFHFSLAQKRNISEHSIERRAYWFILKIAKMFPIPTSRNRMINIFIIVNITSTCKR